MEKMEIEVKFHLNDIQSLRKRIVALGARSVGRFFEKNLRFENFHSTLKNKKLLLRLRRDRVTTLTVKSPAPALDDQFKKMKELEVEVSDFDTMHHILAALGFHCAQVYEKWRETLSLEGIRFCMDSMPFGNFIELEGQEEDIKHYSSRLGLQWNSRILLNYLEIFEILRRDLNLDFTDVTFDNFKNIAVRLSDYLDIMKADRKIAME